VATPVAIVAKKAVAKKAAAGAPKKATAKKAAAPAKKAAPGGTPPPAAPGVDPAAVPAAEPEQAPPPAPPELPIPDALKRGNGGVADTGAGILLGIFAYALLANYLEGGAGRVKWWLGMKFVNRSSVPKRVGTSGPRPERGKHREKAKNR
jgi:hypothetical protein